MSDLREVGDIQINEDLRFLQKEWRVQRIGWVVLLLLILAGLLGLLGHGPLSKAQIGDADSLAVSYERLTRHGSDTDLVITLPPVFSEDSTSTLYISRNYIKDYEVQNIIPEPESSGVNGDFVYYEFEREDRRRPATITFHLRPTGYGNKRATIALKDAGTLKLTQFVWP